jgi:hypothetical protein
VAVLRSALEENDIHFSFVADTARLFVPERDAERVKEIAQRTRFGLLVFWRSTGSTRAAVEKKGGAAGRCC